MDGTSIPQFRAANLCFVIVGVLFSCFGMLLCVPVAPMLFLARDSRDLVGGIAGSVIIAIMLLGGSVLILRQKAPPALVRAFYIFFGLLALTAGALSLYGLASALLSGQSVNKSGAGLPILMIGLAINWLRLGFKSREIAF